jgi:hypothetical protein
MSFQEYKPNPIIVCRAASVWVEMLAAPKYDNLGTNSPEPPSAIIANKTASLLAGMTPKNNDPETLEKFRVALIDVLSGPLEWEDTFCNPPHKYTTTFSHLGVDYHPDIPLCEAAKRAGLEMTFPWKTTMWLYADCLSVSNGYAAPSMWHYPLGADPSADNWLVTTLQGEDVKKVIALIQSGVITKELVKP